MVSLGLCLFIWVTATKEGENVLIKGFLSKFMTYVSAIIFMVLAKDTKGVGVKSNPDPDKIKSLLTPTSGKKTFIFIRHGESDWNNVFNKGFGPSFIVRLLSAMFNELRLYAFTNSVFIDSPLNMEGVAQAVELAKFVENANKTVDTADASFKWLNLLAGNDTNTSSVIVSSTLRRAIATTTLGLWPRVQKTGEPIMVLSSLQEMSRNVDTYALSAANTVADLPFDRIKPHCKNFDPAKAFDVTQNHGNKSRSFYGIKRLKAFNEWAFKRPEDVIIIGGHSLWFKYYFQTYLPHLCEHEAKSKKITNSGVVAFTVNAHNTGEIEDLYRIDPDSITQVYGGFTVR
jgi:bisphosphoglycerate-dependent phosphoglycerate mutase